MQTAGQVERNFATSEFTFPFFYIHKHLGRPVERLEVEVRAFLLGRIYSVRRVGFSHLFCESQPADLQNK